MLRLAGHGSGYRILLLWSAAQHCLRSRVEYATGPQTQQRCLCRSTARPVACQWARQRAAQSGHGIRHGGRPCSLTYSGRMAWHDLEARQGTVRLHAT